MQATTLISLVGRFLTHKVVNLPAMKHIGLLAFGDHG